MATTNKFQVFAETSSNIYSDSSYENAPSRLTGGVSNTSISSQLMNTACLTSSLISVALLDAIFGNSAESTPPANVGLSTSRTKLAKYITYYLKRFKPNNAGVADTLEMTQYSTSDAGSVFTSRVAANRLIHVRAIITYGGVSRLYNFGVMDCDGVNPSDSPDIRFTEYGQDFPSDNTELREHSFLRATIEKDDGFPFIVIWFYWLSKPTTGHYRWNRKKISDLTGVSGVLLFWKYIARY